jgi:hypothetical protein
MSRTSTASVHSTTTGAGSWSQRVQRFGAGVVMIAAGALFAPGAGALNTGTVLLNEASNARVITVAPGYHLTLTLHSTYWTVVPLGAQHTLRQAGNATTVGSLTQGSSRCVPGQGCGTVTVHYVATGAGQVRLRATRSTCGEAMRCTPSQSLWTTVIRVR